jgi:hypothetical protein
MKLPFGGFDADEEPIDERADPAPLLAEIANCALEGAPLRPALARWFHQVWSSGRIQVRKAAGRPTDTPSHVRIDAVLLAREKMRQYGSWDGSRISAKAITETLQELGCPEVAATTFRDWVRDYDAAKAVGDEDIMQSLIAESEETAKLLFAQCAEQAIAPEKALVLAQNYLGGKGLPSDLDDLRKLQRTICGC